MLFRTLRIETRREMPARARTHGEGLLIRAGYTGSSGQWSRLGELALARLRARIRGDPHRIETLAAALLKTPDGEILIEGAAGGVHILRCVECSYVARLEKARARKAPLPAEAALPLQRVATPGCRTIESLAAFLGVPQAKTGKALLYSRPNDDTLVFVVIRGDMQLSEVKLHAAAGMLSPAAHEQIIGAGAVPGYASPIGLRDAWILVDDLLPESSNLVVGANEEGHHLLNANLGRDFQADLVADLTLAQPGDPCCICGAPLQQGLGYLLADAEGVRYPEILRMLADLHHDDKGLRLPLGAAPFDVYLLHLPSRQAETRPAAEALHQILEAAAISVLFDDREERAGVKFSDADLLGCPFRLTVAERHLQNGMVELKFRSDSHVELVPYDQVLGRIQALIAIQR